jgi:hypothetical protein
MALEACRECGQKVSTQARRCPSCGVKHPTTNIFWLAVRRWVAVIGLLAALAYCTVPAGSRLQFPDLLPLLWENPSDSQPPVRERPSDLRPQFRDRPPGSDPVPDPSRFPFRG